MVTTAPGDVEIVSRVHGGAVRALAARAARVDGVAPLDEATLLTTRGGARATHLVVRRGRRLVGYGQVRDDGATSVAEVVVDPGWRRRRIGSALLDKALETAGGTVEVWAHGDLPAARALLATVGARPVRELWVMGRDLGHVAGSEGSPRGTSGDAAALPTGVVLRSFRVGVDEAAWLAVNARAFADHPEQGRITLSDLRAREREPWFSADGFLLASLDERLLGSVWTKVHAPGAMGAGGVGEIYVLGIDPDAQGMGLGRALTEAGLAHLARLGVSRAALFVDAGNTVAVATYRAAGFTRETVHTRYRLTADRSR
ncbi:MAG: mycothiol synthase [Micrococcales bacterium]|nr:mycothiol synthase [Micrococcales bacterium]